MAIFVESEEDFERGTTISSKIRLTNSDGDYVSADITLDFDEEENVEDVRLEVVDPETGDVLKEEAFMEALVDDDGDKYYLDSWTTPEDLDPQEYYLVHRATVGEEPFKLTRVVEVVKVRDEC